MARAKKASERYQKKYYINNLNINFFHWGLGNFCLRAGRRLLVFNSIPDSTIPENPCNPIPIPIPELE